MRLRSGTLLSGLIVLLGSGVWAASERELSLDEMTAVADEIVVGEVERTEAQWHGKSIVTVSTVRVEESLKGAPGVMIEITEPGGTAVHPRLGVPVTMDVSGQGRLGVGERVVLFVQRRAALRQVVGAQQGKFVVREEPVTGEPAVAVGPKRLMVERDGGRTRVGSRAMTLAEMRARVHAVLGEKTP